MVGQPKNHFSDLQFEKISEACNHSVWEDEFHNRSVFWFELLCEINALDKRSRDGYFCVRSQYVAVNFWKSIPMFRDA